MLSGKKNGVLRTPNVPPKIVRYGEQSTDEMSLCIFEVMSDNIGELLSLIQDDSRHRKLLERALLLNGNRK